jgi:hypothetical protein
LLVERGIGKADNLCPRIEVIATATAAAASTAAATTTATAAAATAAASTAAATTTATASAATAAASTAAATTAATAAAAATAAGRRLHAQAGQRQGGSLLEAKLDNVLGGAAARVVHSCQLAAGIGRDPLDGWEAAHIELQAYSVRPEAMAFIA